MKPGNVMVPLVTTANRPHSRSCPVCKSQTSTVHHAREMMLGTRHVFLYWECAQCGCLFLDEVPENIGEYYPAGSYYSLQTKPTNIRRKLRDRLYLSPFSFLVNWRQRTDLDVMRRVRLRKNMSLLDVGCGSGYLLADLRELGYNARGIDPFVPSDICDRFGVRVQRRPLTDVREIYDAILFRHSLEHMPIDSLQLARHRLKKDGICVVCIPVVGWAWQHYRTDWAQLDAPRHLFLHTPKSFEILAASSGFRIERTVYDSNEFQFWASESYRNDVPLEKAVRPRSFDTIRMRWKARSLNRRQFGDTAQFYLRPTV